jgi:tetratricopeptide (TPR) repeat protein
MAIKGSLREASLPDVLQLLAMGQKTGCLSLTDRASFGSIYFDRGRVIWATIINRPDRLGGLLVKNGVITTAQLDAALAEQRAHPGQRLGTILMDQGALSKEQLERYVRIQVEEAVYHLFTWTQGSFYFEPDQSPDGSVLLVSLNPENLLLEGARRVDEWGLIEKKIPTLDLVFRVDAGVGGADLELTEVQRKIVPLLDGAHSVQEVIDESGLVEFDVGKALFGLIQAGFAHPLGRRQPEPRALPSARADEHRNLGVAFYKAGMFDEALREFRRTLELEPGHLEARFFIALLGLRTGDDRLAVKHFKEVAEKGGARAGVFAGLALALERAGRLEEAIVSTEEAIRLAPRLPQLLLSRAVLRLKAGDAAGARGEFDAYRAALEPGAAPAAAYYAFAIIATAMAGDVAAAARLADEGLAHYPESAVLLLHAGAVRERRGDWDAAEELYRRAAHGEGVAPQAFKALGDARYRRAAYDEAAEAYARVLEIAPGLGEDIHFKLGNIHYKRGERAEAVEQWRRTLELNPGHAVARTNLELVERVLG